MAHIAKNIVKIKCRNCKNEMDVSITDKQHKAGVIGISSNYCPYCEDKMPEDYHETFIYRKEEEVEEKIEIHKDQLLLEL